MLPLEKLTLSGKAVATCFDISPEKGTKCIAVTFVIVDDERYAGELTPAWKGWFSGKATERTIESLQHMGFESDDLSLLEDCDADRCAELLPNVVQLVLDPEQGQDGNWYQRVQWVNRLGYGKFVAQNPLKGSDLKAFAAQMKGAMRNARGPKQPRANGGGSQPHPNAPGNKDDIPF
jgi:hypothetical protein